MGLYQQNPPDTSDHPYPHAERGEGRDCAEGAYAVPLGSNCKAGGEKDS